MNEGVIIKAPFRRILLNELSIYIKHSELCYDNKVQVCACSFLGQVEEN